jgi:hypothetical protein
MFLSVLSRLMVCCSLQSPLTQTSNLEEPRGGSEFNALKSVALDHLGNIAARLRAIQQQVEIDPLPTLDEVGDLPELTKCNLKPGNLYRRCGGSRTSYESPDSRTCVPQW